MKKILTVLVTLLLLFGVTSCGTKNTDAIKFKEEYESLNDVENSSGQKHRSISISKNNPFVYATPEDIIEKVENKETFYVYFGSSYCPWCRSVLEKAIESAKENKIDTIYYIDIWDGDHVENFRDVYKLNKKGKPEVVTNGTEEYYKLLDYFDNVLGEYTLTNEDGNSISVGEKRIFAPNFIYVEDGKSIRITEGISEKQTSARETLTDKILEDEKNLFNEFFQN